jgi:hypothetical protein
MRYETIGKCGELGIEFNNIDERITIDFLKRLLRGIVERSTQYFDETGDHVFIYRERQMHSVICPAIADLASSYLLELPLKRKPAGEEEYSGSVDYWVSYRNRSFLIELKHTYFAYRNVEAPRRKIAEKMEEALNQLRSIRIDQCRYAAGSDKMLTKMALLTIVFYEGSKKEISEKEVMKLNFKNILRKMLNNTGLMRTSNLVSLWVLDRRLVMPFEYQNEEYEIYPAIGFVGKILEKKEFSD